MAARVDDATPLTPSVPAPGDLRPAPLGYGTGRSPARDAAAPSSD
jgi:hypothetical protein